MVIDTFSMSSNLLIISEIFALVFYHKYRRYWLNASHLLAQTTMCLLLVFTWLTRDRRSKVTLFFLQLIHYKPHAQSGSSDTYLFCMHSCLNSYSTTLWEIFFLKFHLTKILKVTSPVAICLFAVIR